LTIQVAASAVSWRIQRVHLPAGKHLDRKKTVALLADRKANAVARFNTAGQITFLGGSRVSFHFRGRWHASRSVS
jgi:hypothetical protein